MKKNQGFSLIELIVVIAIMAILVGVLAPAYLRYVEKSRRSTDVSTITDIMGAAEKVASEAQYDEWISTTTVFKISVTNAGAINLDVTGLKDGDGGKVKKAFEEIANVAGASLKAKAFKENAGTNGSMVQGAVGKDGNITWTGDGLFDKTHKASDDDGEEWFCGYAPDFAKKLS